MSLRVWQAYVRCDDRTAVKRLIKDYVRIHQRRFYPDRRFQRSWTQVCLRYVHDKRRFAIAMQGEWALLWERVKYLEFGDPALLRYLSEKLQTTAFWFEAVDDYNIWAYQRFESGAVVAEEFQPKSYFLGKDETKIRWFAGPYCHDRIAQFEKKTKLPYFLRSSVGFKRDKPKSLHGFSVALKVAKSPTRRVKKK